MTAFSRGAGVLIAFSGVDYAGKSTQIDMLESRLAAQNAASRVTWFRPGYGPELDALRRLIRGVRPGAIPAPGRSAARERTFRRTGVGEAWVVMACLDTLLQYAVKIRRQVDRGQIAICDRYVRDALIDLELRFPAVMCRAGRLVRSVMMACPEPDFHFLLMLDERTILERHQSKREPFPDSDGIRGRRLEAYRKWAEEGSATVLNAGRSREAIHAEVVAALARRGVCRAGA